MPVPTRTGSTHIKKHTHTHTHKSTNCTTEGTQQQSFLTHFLFLPRSSQKKLAPGTCRRRQPLLSQHQQNVIHVRRLQPRTHLHFYTRPYKTTIPSCFVTNTGCTQQKDCDVMLTHTLQQQSHWAACLLVAGWVGACLSDPRDGVPSRHVTSCTRTKQTQRRVCRPFFFSVSFSCVFASAANVHRLSFRCAGRGYHSTGCGCTIPVVTSIQIRLLHTHTHACTSVAGVSDSAKPSSKTVVVPQELTMSVLGIARQF